MSELIKQDFSPVYENIREIMLKSRQELSQTINTTLVRTYWEVGRAVVEDEQNHSDRAEYGQGLIKELSKELIKEFGRGFSRSNLQNMRNFYLAYPKSQTLSGKLSWSHYTELLGISDVNKRSFYEKETANANWSVRELRRQIRTSLYERLLLSQGKDNKEKVLDLALKGNEISKPEDVVKDPYVFEFLGIPENKPMLESDLEKALLEHIETFLLELGKGFMYVGLAERIKLTIQNTLNRCNINDCW